MKLSKKSTVIVLKSGEKIQIPSPWQIQKAKFVSQPDDFVVIKRKDNTPDSPTHN